MAPAVFLSHRFSIFAQVLLHGGINDELLTNGVPGQLPSELALPSCLRVVVIRVADVLIVLFDLAVIVLNDVRNP